jgi:hypothetical protein
MIVNIQGDGSIKNGLLKDFFNRNYEISEVETNSLFYIWNGEDIKTIINYATLNNIKELIIISNKKLDIEEINNLRIFNISWDNDILETDALKAIMFIWQSCAKKLNQFHLTYQDNLDMQKLNKLGFSLKIKLNPIKNENI